VRDHPAASQATKTAVQQQLRLLRTQVSPALFAMTSAPDLTAAVTLAQTELDNLLPAAPAQAAPAPQLPPAPDVDFLDPLTERELEVLHLLAQGLTNREIAGRLTVVLGTVKAHNHHIFSKLGASNRVQALARARQLGLIS
jgi:ATP/maltotriose-dependent transcriptional regulator MalT